VANRVDTSAPLECPRCGLTSPGIAVRCDCGFKFDLTPADRDAALSADYASSGWRVFVGAVLILGGLGLTLVGFVVARAFDGLFLVFSGAVLGGAAMCARGLSARRRLRRAMTRSRM